MRNRIEIDVVTGEETIIPYTDEENAEAELYLLNQPEPSYQLYKSTFINRMDEDIEAEVMEAVLAAAPAKMRMLFNSVEYFVSNDPLFSELHAAIAATLGTERADQLLAKDDAQ